MTLSAAAARPGAASDLAQSSPRASIGDEDEAWSRDVRSVRLWFTRRATTDEGQRDDPERQLAGEPDHFESDRMRPTNRFRTTMTILLVSMGALVGLVVILALLLKRRTGGGGRTELSSRPPVRQPSCVRVLRTEDEIRAVATQVRAREHGIARAAERRAARLSALVQPPT